VVWIHFPNGLVDLRFAGEIMTKIDLISKGNRLKTEKNNPIPYTVHPFPTVGDLTRVYSSLVICFSSAFLEEKLREM